MFILIVIFFVIFFVIPMLAAERGLNSKNPEIRRAVLDWLKEGLIEDRMQRWEEARIDKIRSEQGFWAVWAEQRKVDAARKIRSSERQIRHKARLIEIDEAKIRQ